MFISLDAVWLEYMANDVREQMIINERTDECVGVQL